eukprot:868883-Prorocentrum_minimum.AAC.2
MKCQRSATVKNACGMLCEAWVIPTHSRDERTSGPNASFQQEAPGSTWEQEVAFDLTGGRALKEVGAARR